MDPDNHRDAHLDRLCGKRRAWNVSPELIDDQIACTKELVQLALLNMRRWIDEFQLPSFSDEFVDACRNFSRPLRGLSRRAMPDANHRGSTRFLTRGWLCSI
jgi:hypothetical protein